MGISIYFIYMYINREIILAPKEARIKYYKELYIMIICEILLFYFWGIKIQNGRDRSFNRRDYDQRFYCPFCDKMYVLLSLTNIYSTK